MATANTEETNLQASFILVMDEMRTPSRNSVTSTALNPAELHHKAWQSPVLRTSSATRTGLAPDVLTPSEMHGIFSEWRIPRKELIPESKSGEICGLEYIERDKCRFTSSSSSRYFETVTSFHAAYPKRSFTQKIKIVLENIAAVCFCSQRDDISSVNLDATVLASGSFSSDLSGDLRERNGEVGIQSGTATQSGAEKKESFDLHLLNNWLDQNEDHGPVDSTVTLESAPHSSPSKHSAAYLEMGELSSFPEDDGEGEEQGTCSGFEEQDTFSYETSQATQDDLDVLSEHNDQRMEIPFFSPYVKCNPIANWETAEDLSDTPNSSPTPLKRLYHTDRVDCSRDLSVIGSAVSVAYSALDILSTNSVDTVMNFVTPTVNHVRKNEFIIRNT